MAGKTKKTSWASFLGTYAPCPVCGGPIIVSDPDWMGGGAAHGNIVECGSCGYATSLRGRMERWRKSPLARRGRWEGRWRTWIPTRGNPLGARGGSRLAMLKADGRKATRADIGRNLVKGSRFPLVWRRSENVGGRRVSADYASYRNAMLASKADVVRRALRGRGLRGVKRFPGARRRRSTTRP